MSYILALDSGGTKCDALLLRFDGQLMGWGHYSAPGYSGRNLPAMTEAVKRALIAEKMSLLVVVTQGSELPISIFTHCAADRYEFIPCGESASARALAGVRHGLVVLAGTGAFVDGLRPDGRGCHVDGCGPVFGDYGSGHFIGLRALQAVFRHEFHPRHRTTLYRRINEFFGIRSPWALHGRNLFGQDRSLVASLARLVNEEAEAGDRVSRQILEDAGRALAASVADAVDLLDAADEKWPMVGTGSVLQKSDICWTTLCQEAVRVAPRFFAVRPTAAPVVGVAIFALEKLHGAAAAAPAVERLRQEVAAYPATATVPSRQ